MAASKAVTAVVLRCEEAKGTKVLDLKSSDLTTVPNAVYFILKEHTLKQCSLSWNHLTKFPEKFPEKFPTLQVLSLRGNRISSVGPEICVLQELQALDLADNIICEFPSALYGLQKLRIINLARNKITCINIDTVLNNLPWNLKYIDLGGNPLDKGSLERMGKSQFREKVRLEAYPSTPPPGGAPPHSNSSDDSSSRGEPSKDVVYRENLSFVIRNNQPM